MITMTQMYWFTRLDSIECFFTLISIAVSCATVVAGCIWFIQRLETYDNDDRERLKHVFFKPIVWGSVLSAIFLPLAILTPTTKDMAIIYVVPKIVNNDKVQQIPDKLLDLANAKIEEWTKTKVEEKK